MLRRIALALPALLAAGASTSLAQEVPAAHPANSAEPPADLTPATGLPAYDEDSESPAPARPGTLPAAPEDEPSEPRADPRARQYRFGLTLVTPVAGIVEQRVPVSLTDGASGRMSAWNYGGEASVRHLSEDLVAYGSFNYRRTDFAFSGMPAPWEDTDQYRLNAHVEGRLDDSWWWFANGGLRLAAERSASLGDALTGGLAAGAKKMFTPQLSLYLGASVMTRLDNSTLAVPMLGLDWRSGKWSLRTINGLAATYDACGDASLVFDLSALYDNSHFRRSDDPVTGRSRVVEFQEVPVSVGVTKSFGRHSFVRAYAACIAWSDYRFRTDGATTGDFQARPGALFGLSAGARF